MCNIRVEYTQMDPKKKESIGNMMRTTKREVLLHNAIQHKNTNIQS